MVLLTCRYKQSFEEKPLIIDSRFHVSVACFLAIYLNGFLSYFSTFDRLKGLNEVIFLSKISEFLFYHFIKKRHKMKDTTWKNVRKIYTTHILDMKSAKTLLP